MPSKARIDAHGAFQHIIIRGIERKAILKDSQDKKNQLHPFLSKFVSDVSTTLKQNHHL
jgi:hypothetical protein